MSILDKATLHLPMGAAYKSGSVWMSKPLTDDGYFAYTRDSAATRITDCGEVSNVSGNVPRPSYTNGIPGLLIEDTKTNLITNSVNLNGSFTNAGSTSSQNSAPSPEGKINAVTIGCSDSNAHYYTIVSTANAGVQHVFSCWYKGTAGETVRMRSLNSGTGAVDGSKLITFTGEWQREYISFVPGTNYSYAYIVDRRTGVGTATSFQVYGAQIEFGSAPSSFIKTTGSTATRARDSFRITGNRALPYIGGSQGTIYFYVYYKNNGGSYQQFMYYTDASASQSYMFVNPSRYIQTNLNLGTMQSNVQLVDGSFNKIAVKYMPGKQQMYINGQSVASATYGSILNHANIDLGSYAGSSEFGGMEFIEYAHFDQVLSNEEMISLTTL